MILLTTLAICLNVGRKGCQLEVEVSVHFPPVICPGHTDEVFGLLFSPVALGVCETQRLLISDLNYQQLPV